MPPPLQVTTVGRKFGPFLMLLSSLALWVSSRMTWVNAAVDDDKAGAAHMTLTGSTWALETTAVALLVLAGAVAGVALRRGARRIVGIVVAVAAAGVAWRPVALLTYGADPQRTQALLEGARANANAVSVDSISSWAQVTEATVAAAGPALALVGAAAALLGGVLLAMQPGVDGARSTKYESRAARAERLAEELDSDPDSGRVLWDALDEGIDPTDTQGQGR